MIKVTQGCIVASKLMLLGGGMTRGSVKDYMEAVRGRYLKASRKEKGRILDKFYRSLGATARRPSASWPRAYGKCIANPPGTAQGVWSGGRGLPEAGLGSQRPDVFPPAAALPARTGPGPGTVRRTSPGGWGKRPILTDESRY
jgi:hypothetical protein